MKRLFCLFAGFLLLTNLHAQTFSWSGFSPILDNQTDTILIGVSGLNPSIDIHYGLSKVCFDMYHTYKSDLEIRLLAPDGTNIMLVQNTGGSGDNFLGTCVANDGVPFSNGQPPYTGIFLPQQDLGTVNNGQDPNGIWRLLVRDNASMDTGSVRNVTLYFSSHPPSMQGTSMGAQGPLGPFLCATCVCPGGATGCDLLPDVTASYREINLNHNEVPGALYVANATPNIGYGPLEVYAIDSCFCNGEPWPCSTPCPNGGEFKHVIRQRIYRKVPGQDTLDYYDRRAGAMTFHPEHNHLHVDNWSSYTLRTRTANPDARTWPIVGTGVKQSFCLVNLGKCPSTPGQCIANNGDTVRAVPNQDFGFQTGCGLNQGIYPGNFDTYGMSLNGPIPLTNICNGTYYIVSITDPENRFLESDENNNWVAVPITLTKQQTAPVITASRSAQLCGNDSVVLTASAAANYLWSTGDTTRTLVVRSPGTYTVTTSCGASSYTSQPFTVGLLPAGAAPSVSIRIASGNNPTCNGSVVSFIADSALAGLSPVFQWKVNGVSVGNNSNQFISDSLRNGQTVTCAMTSSIGCFSSTPVFSNTIQIGVIPTGQPSIALTQVKGSNPQCLGDTATFVVNVSGGSNTSFQWYVNNTAAGNNSDTFSTSTLTNGQTVFCRVNTTAVCPERGTIGTGTALNTTTSGLGAAYPTYYGNGRQQYLVLASELSAAGLRSGKLASMSFRTGTAVGSPALLKNYTIKLAPTSATSLSSAFQNPAFTTVYGPFDFQPVINSANSHLFTTPFNWNGTSNLLVDICFNGQVIGRRAYQTYQSPTPFISTTYYQADSTSGAQACIAASGTTGSVRPNISFLSSGEYQLESPAVLMSVNSTRQPSVTIQISSGSNPQCAGATTVFRATPDNTGSGPAFQWTKNRLPLDQGAGNLLTLQNLQRGDTISCIMTTAGRCDPSLQVQSNDVIIDIPDPVYTFTGNGSWENAANWSQGKIPPRRLLACSEIIINPVSGGESVLSYDQVITTGSKITVAAGKKFRVVGNLKIQ